MAGDGDDSMGVALSHDGSDGGDKYDNISGGFNGVFDSEKKRSLFLVVSRMVTLVFSVAMAVVLMMRRLSLVKQGMMVVVKKLRTVVLMVYGGFGGGEGPRG